MTHLRDHLSSVSSLAAIWEALAQACAEWRVTLAEAHVLHPEEIDQAWQFRPEVSPTCERTWRRRLIGIPEEFNDWLGHGGFPEHLAPPPPWPECSRLTSDPDTQAQRLVLPIGASPPLGFLIFMSENQEADEGFPRFIAALARELPSPVSRCLTVESHELQLAALRSLTESSRAFQSCRDIETAATVIIEMLRGEFGFDVALLALVEGPIRLLRGHSVVPESAVELGNIDFPLRTSHHALATITSQGVPVHAPSAEPSDPRLTPLRLREPVWQPVWLPLLAKGEPVGLIIAFNREHRGQLSEGQRRALELLANQAAMAVESLSVAREFEHEAVRDALTGLYNRRHLDRILEQEVRRFRRYGTPLSLLMIDLNDFKAFNDEHGHLAGDELLKAAAKMILENIRETDIAARYGGDEFVVLMPSSTEEQARAATQRILSAVVQRNNHLRGRPDQIFSLTIGHHAASADTAERVLEAADRMMYDRKVDSSRRRLLDQLVAPRGTPVGQHARLIFSLMKTLALRDPGHVPHARRVMGYTVMMCQRLGLGPTQSEETAMAAILHDLGKVVINAEILRRPGPLTASEFMLVRSHPVVAADMLAEMTFLEHPLRIIRHHHERWDGRTTGEHPGYPDGLSGETIPLGSRIIRIADMFDALTSEKPHARALRVPEAVEVLRQEAGKSLDPNLVAKLLPLFEKLPGPIDPDAVDFPQGL